MISINTNNGGLFAAKAASQSQAAIDSAMQRLSTGSRINNAKDDAAGQAIATRLTAEIQGLEIASRNVADGQSLVDTAEGALQETHTLLLRMREIGVQAANGTLSTSDNQALDAEFQQLVKEIDRIAQNTTWAGAALLNGDAAGAEDSTATFSFQAGVGNNSGADVFSVTVKNADSTTLDCTLPHQTQTIRTQLASYHKRVLGRRLPRWMQRLQPYPVSVQILVRSQTEWPARWQT